MSSRSLFRNAIGKYQIQALLGRGGMGEVYKAYDPSLDRVVALKTIRAELSDPQTLERFKREGKASGRLRHPFIVTVYDLGEAEGTLFMAMEYLEGESLAAVLGQRHLSFETKVRILVQVLEALDYAHAQAVVHRDIKPSNVQVLPDGSIKLLDFGVARIVTAESISRTGSVVGTPYYMAPEQLRGEKVGHRGDIYSTGALGYEMFTRRRPFDGDSLTEILLKVINELPAPMNNAWSRAFPELERIIGKAMEKAPERRFSSAGEMAADLLAFLDANRQSILRTQQELESVAGEVLGRGRALAAEGKIEETKALLATLTEQDPDALEAKTFLNSLEPATRVAEPTPAPAPTPMEQAVAVRPSTSQARRGLLAMAGVVLVAVGVVSGAALFWRSLRDRGGAEPPSSTLVGGPTTTVPGSFVPTASSVGRETPTSTPSPAVHTGLCIEAAPRGNASQELMEILTGVLEAEGRPVQSTCAAAAVAVRVKADVSVRPAPFAAPSARTADYVGTLEVRTGEGPRARFDFDGHVMEFGDAVARAKALRELASRMAKRIGPAR